MKRFIGLCLLSVLGLTVAPLLFAQSTNRFSGDVYFKKAKIQMDSATTGSFTNAVMSNRTRYVSLNAGDFFLAADGAVVSAATEPARVIVSSVAVLEWNVTESAKVQTSFVVPQDYVSGGAFICPVKLDAASADTTLDFEVYVEANGAAPDSATTNQTPVAVANSTTNIQNITLTVATDTFAAGNVVHFNVWRAAGTGASSDVNIFGCAFSYTADM